MLDIQNNVSFGAKLKFSGEYNKEFAKKFADINKRFMMRTAKYPDEEVLITFTNKQYYLGYMQTKNNKLSLGGMNKWFNKITVEDFGDNLAILFKLEKKLFKIRDKNESLKDAFVGNRHEFDKLNTVIKTHRGNSNAAKQAKAMREQVKLQAANIREKLMLCTQKFNEVKSEMWDYADEYLQFAINQLSINIKL